MDMNLEWQRVRICLKSDVFELQESKEKNCDDEFWQDLGSPLKQTTENDGEGFSK